MSTHNPTPCDNSDRLEPQLRPLGENPDSYRCADFENDEGAAVLKVYAEREGSGYAMHVTGMAWPLSLVVDGGGRVVPASAELVEGIDELLHMAQRGREDFEYQDRHGDYTAEDRAAADRRWLLAEAAAKLLAQRGQ